MKSLILTYLLTYGGAITSLWRPYYGFLIYVCFAILKPESLWFWSVPAGNYSRIVAIGLLIGWALHGFGDWRMGKGGIIIWAMVGFWLVILFSTLFIVPIPDLGWEEVEPKAKTFLPILAGMTLINSWSKLKALVWTIVLSQGYVAYEFNMTYYTADMFDPHEFYHGALDNNGIALTMVTSLGLAFFLGMHAEKWWQKGAALASAGFMAHVVLFSNSRAGMFALIITGLTCFILTPKKPRDYLILLLAVVLVIRLSGEGVQKRFLSSFEEQGESKDADAGGGRIEFWKGCTDSMMREPFGVGAKYWPFACTRYGIKEGRAGHSTWLQIGAELGWPGLGFLVLIYGACLVRLWPLRRERAPVPDPWVRYLARMVIASLIGFVVAAQFSTADGVELSYYIALVGAATLKLTSLAPAPAQTEYTEPAPLAVRPPRTPRAAVPQPS